MEGLLFCKYCKIHVTGDRKRCPLCQNPLYGEPDPDSSLFPNVSPKAWKIQKLILHSFLFVSFAVVVICLTVDALLPESHSYPWYVAGAVLCMWFCLGNALYRRHNIPKNILWLVVWISLLSVAWDACTGWKHWSVDYVIPALCITAMAAVPIISKAMGRRLTEYMVYLIIDSLFGVIPLIFLLLDWVQVRYPSILCAAGSILSLGALWAFQGTAMVEEVKKRLHF